MTTIYNSTKSKAVKITKQEYGFIASYVQFFSDGGEQLLHSKTYKRENTAIKWANKQLGLI